jgi:hypothetical protein
MMEVFVRAVGLVTPGMFGWKNAKEVLDGTRGYQPDDMPLLKPAMLQPNERRRTSNTIKLALQAIHDALGDDTTDEYTSVFASSEGDMEIVDHICNALTQEGRPVSPTHFHNSVHNAPAGYASIAGGSHKPSTSVAALQGSFATGLLEATVQLITNRSPALCVVYDNCVPFPLKSFIPIDTPFAAAMLLSPDTDNSLVQLTLELSTQLNESRMSDSRLEGLRMRNPAARSLPLFQLLATGKAASLQFPYLPGLGLNVEVAPC